MNRNNKHANDEAIFDILFQNLPAGVGHCAATLPGDQWQWERRINRRNPKRTWKFFGCNNTDKKSEILTMQRVKEEQNAIYEKIGCGSRLLLPIHGRENFSHMMGLLNQKMSVIYADFCGSWCKENNFSLQRMFGRQLLADESFLIITSQIKCPRQDELSFELLRAVANNEYAFEDPMFNNTHMNTPNFHYATKGIETLVQGNAAAGGYFAKLVYFNMYEGDRMGHEMLSFCYQIEKK